MLWPSAFVPFFLGVPFDDPQRMYLGTSVTLLRNSSTRRLLCITHCFTQHPSLALNISLPVVHDRLRFLCLRTNLASFYRHPPHSSLQLGCSSSSLLSRRRSRQLRNRNSLQSSLALSSPTILSLSCCPLRRLSSLPFGQPVDSSAQSQHHSVTIRTL